MSVECFVSVLDIPSCLPDMVFRLPGDLAAAAYGVENNLLILEFIIQKFRTGPNQPNG